MTKPLICSVLAAALLWSGCGGGGELSVREKMTGTWLIANSGQLQPYLDGKPQFRNLPVKNSKITFFPDGRVRGWIEDISYNPNDPASAANFRIVEQWEGQWELSESEEWVRIKGTPYERPIKNPTPGGKTVRTVQFTNEMPIYFSDEQTLNLESEGAVFRFKLVSRKIQES